MAVATAKSSRDRVFRYALDDYENVLKPNSYDSKIIEGWGNQEYALMRPPAMQEESHYSRWQEFCVCLSLSCLE